MRVSKREPSVIEHVLSRHLKYSHGYNDGERRSILDSRRMNDKSQREKQLVQMDLVINRNDAKSEMRQRISTARGYG